jgi:hypothetical protein
MIMIAMPVVTAALVAVLCVLVYHSLSREG